MKTRDQSTKKDTRPAERMPTSEAPFPSLQQSYLRLQRTMGNQAVMRLLDSSGGKESSAPAHKPEPLAVNEPGDRFEREADSVAEQVMRTPALAPAPRTANVKPGALQRKCAHCEEEEENQAKLQRRVSEGDSRISVQRKCSQCEEEEAKKQVQRSDAGGGADAAVAPDSVHDVLRSPGRPLDSSARSFMEPRFGREFSGVRIHTGAAADRAAREVSAAAFTVGPDIAFASGRYAPETEAGRHLLAHELTHTVQQGHAAGLMPEALKVGHPDDPAEREAGAAADFALLPGARTMTGFSHDARAVRRGFGDPPGGKLRTTGLTEAEWAKIKATRKFFNLPERPTAGQPTIVGVLVDDKSGKEYRLKSGEDAGPYGGTQRGNVPRGPGEAFTKGGPHQGNIATHVEGHAAAVMHEQKITEATLLIEEMPCEGACDATRGWDPVKGDWAGSPKARPATPNISTALPPGTKLTVVDPEAAGIYRSSQIPSTILKPAAPPEPLGKPPSAPPESEGIMGPKKISSINTPPPAPKVPGGLAADPLAEKLLEGKLTPKLPEPPAGKLSPKSGVGLAAAEGEAALSARVLARVGNIAMDIVLLVAAVVWELVVVPKLNKIIKQLEQWQLELEASRRKRMEEQIKKKFDIYEAKHIGRIIKSCWLGKLRELEKAGKKAFVNVGINVSFEDTSGRFQLFEETPPESLFDLEFYDVDLVSVSVSDQAQKDSVGKLARCESCGAGGRDKSFIGNNPLWQQLVSFSFEAPKAAEIAKEYEKEPDIGACIADSACFIATACYGTSRAPEIDALRQFRDRVLMRSRSGRWFVRKYYRLSPPVAVWLWRNERARSVVREGLVAPLVKVLRRMGFGR
ncbi:MAG: DUF4157 domain-containing protein [Acidobacteriia bacterium]|nr:DUF4157 domain-containing protein [Terriglobia bacterium]